MGNTMTDQRISDRLDAERHTHGDTYPCKCGEVFDTERERKAHIKRSRAEAFNDAARDYIERYYGDPFLSYFDSLRGGMGSILPWGECNQPNCDAEQELTPENVEAATVHWIRGALVEPNRTELERFAAEAKTATFTVYPPEADAKPSRAVLEYEPPDLPAEAFDHAQREVIRAAEAGRLKGDVPISEGGRIRYIPGNDDGEIIDVWITDTGPGEDTDDDATDAVQTVE